MFKHTISKSGVGASRRLNRRRYEQADARASNTAASQRRLDDLHAQWLQLAMRVEACLHQIQSAVVAPDLMGKLQQNMQTLGQTQAQLRGEAFIQEERRAGRLVPARCLCESWAITRPALDQRRNGGRVIGLKVKGDWHYPAAFMKLTAEDAAALCLLLRGDDAVARYLALHEIQAALGGKSLLQAATDGDMLRAKSLAAAWSDERGLMTHGATPRHAEASARRAARNR